MFNTPPPGYSAGPTQQHSSSNYPNYPPHNMPTHTTFSNHPQNWRRSYIKPVNEESSNTHSLGLDLPPVRSGELSPVRTFPPVPSPYATAVKKENICRVPGLKVEFVEILQTLTQIPDIANLSKSVTKLLVCALNNQIRNNRLIDMYCKAANIVDTKIIYDALVRLCKIPSGAQLKTKMECCEAFKLMLKEIKVKIFCNVDIFGIAKDTAGLPESLIQRVLNESLADLKISNHEAHHRDVMWEVIETMHLQGDIDTTASTFTDTGRDNSGSSSYPTAATNDDRCETQKSSEVPEQPKWGFKDPPIFVPTWTPPSSSLWNVASATPTMPNQEISQSRQELKDLLEKHFQELND